MILYDKTKFDRLKFKFNLSEIIETNYSQAHQDMFVLSMLNGKENGTYVEIGALDAIFISNTYLLETKFNWKGLSVDINPVAKASFDSHGRKNDFIIGDALDIDYASIFKQNGYDKQIDYLQLDIDPSSQTLACLKKIPFGEYRFSVITFETDFYNKGKNKENEEETLRNRNESRDILLSHGYELIAGNVANVGPKGEDDLYPFEDWYVDPLVIDRKLIDLFKVSSEFNKSSEEIILIKK